MLISESGRHIYFFKKQLNSTFTAGLVDLIRMWAGQGLHQGNKVQGCPWVMVNCLNYAENQPRTQKKVQNSSQNTLKFPKCNQKTKRKTT